jgi:hypothetical protein
MLKTRIGYMLNSVALSTSFIANQSTESTKNTLPVRLRKTAEDWFDKVCKACLAHQAQQR